MKAFSKILAANSRGAGDLARRRRIPTAVALDGGPRRALGRHGTEIELEGVVIVVVDQRPGRDAQGARGDGDRRLLVVRRLVLGDDRTRRVDLGLASLSPRAIARGGRKLGDVPLPWRRGGRLARRRSSRRRCGRRAPRRPPLRRDLDAGAHVVGLVAHRRVGRTPRVFRVRRALLVVGHPIPTPAERKARPASCQAQRPLLGRSPRRGHRGGARRDEGLGAPRGPALAVTAREDDADDDGDEGEAGGSQLGSVVFELLKQRRVRRRRRRRRRRRGRRRRRRR